MTFSEEICLPYLRAAQNPDGGWGFRSGSQSRIEPTRLGSPRARSSFPGECRERGDCARSPLSERFAASRRLLARRSGTRPGSLGHFSGVLGFSFDKRKPRRAQARIELARGGTSRRFRRVVAAHSPFDSRIRKCRCRTTLTGAGVGRPEQQAGSSRLHTRFSSCAHRHGISCRRRPAAGKNLLRGCSSIACAPVADGIAGIQWFTAFPANRRLAPRSGRYWRFASTRNEAKFRKASRGWKKIGAASKAPHRSR